MLNGETMTNALIGKKGSSPVAHDLMHLAYDPSGVLCAKGQHKVGVFARRRANSTTSLQ
jgi:hypothetical protein